MNVAGTGKDSEFVILNVGVPIWLIIYCIWNISAFLLIRVDKQRSRKKEWRIRERTFWLVALFFGAGGILAGMYVYRHKTLHSTFVIGVPVLLLLNLAFGYYIWR